MPEGIEPNTESPIVELSIVIPAFNASATITAQLEALVRQEWSHSWEVIVADNGSTDDTAAVITEFASCCPRVRLVDASTRRGPATARNVGVAHARGQLVAFCDADDVVGDSWVRAMGEGLRSFPAVTGPQEQELLNPPWLRNVYGSAVATGAQTFAGIFPFGASANLGIRRDVFVQFGGFDPELSVGEDLELCLRLWHHGVELEFVPDAMIHYRNRANFRALWQQSVKYGAAASMICKRLTALDRPTPSSWGGLKNWLWLVRKLPTLRSKSGRARWVVVAGSSTGRLLGSLQQRRIYL